MPPPTDSLSGISAALPADALRLLVVEDNFVQARTVRRYLTELGYEVVGVAPTAAEAERLFDTTTPDLLLLDVNLAGDGPDGIDLAHTLLGRRRVPVIFLTSFQDAETFRRARAVAPAAFLNKPFDEHVLGHAIELAAQQFVQQAMAAEAPSVAPSPPPLPAADSGLLLRDALWLRENNRLVRVLLQDIQWLEADSNYSHLYMAGGHKYTARTSLRELDDRLPAQTFVRVHRSYTAHVMAIESVDLGNSELHMRGGGVIPLGRSYRDDLLARLDFLA